MIVTVDVGGTKTLVADFDVNGKIGHEVNFPTSKDPNEFFDTLLNNLKDTYPDGTQIDAICVALPGLVVNNETLLYAPNLGWKNVEIKARLAGIYSCPVYVQNDANLAGLGETNLLDTIPPLSLYFTISTGIGSGVVLNGKLDNLLNRSEAGHMQLEYAGEIREWESFASGRSIRDTYGKYARDITSEDTWKEIADKISRGLLALIPALQPDVIIIGGSIGTHFNHYKDYLDRALREPLKLSQVISYPAIYQAQHPEKAVVYGCYYYATHSLDS